MLNKMREPVNGLTHLFAAIAALIGVLVLLVLARDNILRQGALLIYGISLVLMFSASAAYHLADGGAGLMQRLRKMDHSAIYLLIAGTYTPICLYFFSGFWQWGLLSIVWGMALAGVIIKIFILKAPRWINAGIYLVMGWLCIMAFKEMISSMPPAALAWLLAGGLFYSIGAVVYMLKKPNFYPGYFGFHELWHIFVILGALSHFILIAFFIAPG
ncbi:MAG: hemolysin III family protein [Anaerolineae bacterium]|nr:hemolysin III family protein [Anaerolineae bacterium]